jgi:tetratricopeptide (TPR) repeat protein
MKTMRLKFILQYAVTLVTLSVFSVSFAETATPDTIKSIEKNFNYTWSDVVAVPPDKLQVKKIEAFLKTLPASSTLPTADRYALGKLYYKLGTYYAYTAHKPESAITKLNLVDALLTSKENKAWTYNQLAYAYELKYAATGHAADKKKSLAYTNKVINEMYAAKKTREVAFAYSVKGLVLNDAKDYSSAEASYKKSLKIYASLPTGKNDQYQRRTTVLAGIILNQHGREKEALALLEQVKHYWIAKGHLSENPNAATNFISLGQAYLKVGDIEAAHVELCSAMNIYKNVYGDKTTLLAKPYKLLAVAYKKQGDKKQALVYQNKAVAIESA